MYLLKKWWRDIFSYPHTELRGSLNEYWEARGRSEERKELSPWQKERANYALTIIPENEVVTVLDVGAGDGGILQYLKEHRPLLQGIGVDASEVALSALRQKGFTAIDLELADPDSYTSLPDADYVILFEIIEHMPDTEALFAAVRKIARKGILISIPNSGFFTYRIRLLTGKFPLQWAVFPSEHLRFWTVRDMWWWLDTQGIQNARIHTYQGVPILKHIIPSWFAAGMIVDIKIGQN